MNKKIYQIYYDETSFNCIEDGYIPLNNVENLRPDWMEFWVIRKFLLNNNLRDDIYYGFLSPKFKKKTGLNYAALCSYLDAYGPDYDVFLFNHHWDVLAYYQNCFESGDFAHPGLMGLSKIFLSKIGVNINLKSYADSSSSAVFSNYVIANSKYWNKWLDIANKFFNFIEYGSSPEVEKFKENTIYGTAENSRPLPMKIFIQERFPSILIFNNNFKVAPIDRSALLPLTISKPEVFQLLKTCEILKNLYRHTSDIQYLLTYKNIRRNIFRDEMKTLHSSD